MTCFRAVSVIVLGFVGVTGCANADDDPPAPNPNAPLVLDLDDVKENPDAYEWFDFRPNVLKLILAGAAETEHIAILWYTVEDGAVGLHYHSKTESVYVIDGEQTDGKGSYPTGTVYFNPPGSGHEITDSSGFFLLAYSAPPDFAATDRIEAYEPVRIDTTADMTSEHPFEDEQDGVRKFTVPLVEDGGLGAAFIETSSAEDYTYTGNYLLVLDGDCTIDGISYAANTLVVQKQLEPAPFVVSGSSDTACLALGVSF